MIKKRLKKLITNYRSEEGPRFANLNGISQKTPSKRLKIVTYNIHHARKIDKAIQIFKNNKHVNNTDILCLQEMDESSIERMANELKFNYIYYPAIKHPRYGKNFGNAILSKYPMIEDKKIILPHVRELNMQRIAISAKIKVGGQTIRVFCLHMKVFLKTQYRTMQVRKLLSLIKPQQHHVIVAGDFNTFTKKGYEAVVLPLEESHFELATHNVGWNYKHWYLLNKKSALDHIFTRGFKVNHTGKVTSRKASDHVPVWVSVSIQ